MTPLIVTETIKLINKYIFRKRLVHTPIVTTYLIPPLIRFVSLEDFLGLGYFRET